MIIPNKPPLFSLCYCTNRPGSVDLLGLSLSQQPPIYELIFVDAWPGRVERGAARKYLEELGIPIGYFGPPELPGVPTKKGMIRAYNVAAIKSSTPHLIYLQDFAYLPPGWAISWRYALQNHLGCGCISGSARMLNAVPPETLDDISIWNGNPWHKIYFEQEMWVPTHHEMFHTYYSKKFIEDINGFDERGSVIDMMRSLFAQMQYCGIFPEVNPKLRCNMLDHRQWAGSLWSTVSPLPQQYEKQTDLPYPPISPNPYQFKVTVT